MLRSLNALAGRTLIGSDGDLGAIEELYFDDQDWAVRYLAVDAGSWLDGRSVLISPFAFPPRAQASASGKDEPLRVALTRQQLADSPALDIRQSITRGYEQSYLAHFGYPAYWGGPGLWGISGVPTVANAAPDGDYVPVSAQDRELHEVLEDDDASHLRSTGELTSYAIEATDGHLGHVEDFIGDDQDWAIRYLVLDTRDWWPGGRKVLVGVGWVDAIDWTSRSLSLAIERERVRASPEYTPGAPITRDDEQRLHQHYGRSGYWSTDSDARDRPAAP